MGFFLRIKLLLGAMVLTLALCAYAQQSTKKAARPSPVKSAASEGTQPKFKAIWEPVIVQEDIELLSAYFVSPEEGWVTGGRTVMGGGVILHTKDGGANWEVQLGDPQSSDRAYRDLRFVEPKIGFAVQSTGGGDHQLLRTTDGQNWAPSGTVGQHRTDYRFISADVGFYAGGAEIYRTRNGGRTWEPVYQCRVKAEINGLTRDVNCEFDQLY